MAKCYNSEQGRLLLINLWRCAASWPSLIREALSPYVRLFVGPMCTLSWAPHFLKKTSEKNIVMFFSISTRLLPK
eukprot:c5303_g1_i1 orf=93-317(-)